MCGSDCSKLCVNKAKIKCLCAHEVDAKKIKALEINANKACLQDATINRLCVNDLQVGTINHCVKWRAAVTFAANSVYTLGSSVNWDVVLDDPNGNVAVGPFSYTVPVSGYYIFKFHVNVSALSGASTISGIPVSLLTLMVNGSKFVDLQSVFLSFSNAQIAGLSGLVMLNSGDIVQTNFNVIILDPVLGLIPYVGTITIAGNGAMAGQSFFDIHYLSSLNCTPGQMCSVCPPVDIPCFRDVPMTESCNPCMCEQ